jgi:hypothetical protein
VSLYLHITVAVDGPVVAAACLLLGPHLAFTLALRLAFFFVTFFFLVVLDLGDFFLAVAFFFFGTSISPITDFIIAFPKKLNVLAITDVMVVLPDSDRTP